jgi:hypothetical protein
MRCMRMRLGGAGTGEARVMTWGWHLVEPQAPHPVLPLAPLPRAGMSGIGEKLKGKGWVCQPGPEPPPYMQRFSQ